MAHIDTAAPTAVTPANVERALARLNARAWGIALGFLAGFALLIATWALVLQGGPDVGRHLNLLGHYMPGYRVTMAGGLVGFVYAFVGGYAFGRLLGWVYNRLTHGA